ncbi:hypothetical protein Y032_0051g2104 [Ancylostoma ceylanicum]|uniref:Uncharacterized protein n=1 Tax=Ancylostoma ceylanicum TaxID=53326 RepID=A0A016U9G4_9BILA|nr:hypothetical protein Y032_0051g2104 [Ancylostoma ceylanicum]
MLGYFLCKTSSCSHFREQPQDVKAELGRQFLNDPQAQGVRHLHSRTNLSFFRFRDFSSYAPCSASKRPLFMGQPNK